MWGVYEPYSSCDKMCGAGQMLTRRRRQCLSTSDAAGCTGPTDNYTVTECNIHPCFGMYEVLQRILFFIIGYIFYCHTYCTLQFVIYTRY